MSWNNALPYWVYEGFREHDLALMSCCFEEEWQSGSSKVLPAHIQRMHASSFSSWEENGFHHYYHQKFTKKGNQ